MRKQMSKKKRAIMIAVIVLVVLIAGLWICTTVVYNENFDRRFESYEPYMFNVDDFEGVQRTRYQFPSNQGQMLTGYMYSYGDSQKGVIVIVHGFGGGGHNSYMDCADYFARNGYYVFAYDATGNDESEGDGVGGMPQGVIDLQYAISFVEQDEAFADLPIMLFGHSWGGYSACSVLTYHPEVKAVISCSGFNRSSDIMESQGQKEVGKAIYLMLPFVKINEYIKFGKYATNTAMDGFGASQAAVLIMHSADDETVPMKYGYDIYYEKYKDDSRFQFIPFEDRGHSMVYDDMSYINEFNKGFEQWRETLDYDYEAEENQERFSEDRAEYIHENLNREKWCNMLDQELFSQFVAFYDAHLN